MSGTFKPPRPDIGTMQRGAGPIARGMPPGAAPDAPPSARFLYERGATCAAMGAWNTAIAALRQATALDPTLREAWLRLAWVLRLSGDDAGAAEADNRAIALNAVAPQPRRPQKTPSPGKRAAAERKLRDQIAQSAAARPASATLRETLFHAPNDAVALRLLAETWRTAQEPEIIEQLLERALELDPDFDAARLDYAGVLLAQNKWPQALPHIDVLLAHSPRDPFFLTLRAETLTAIGDAAAALEIFAGIINRAPPRQPKFWLAYARALKDAGRTADSAGAYRTAIELCPSAGEAYWGLANLKSGKLTDADLAVARTLLADPAVPAADRASLHYACGAALERQGAYPESFGHYAQGAHLRGAAIAGTVLEYNPDALSEQVRQATSTFTAALFARHARSGTALPTPIFIVGMPRSGSTLIEQILASHSLVEATQELPELSHLVRALDVSRRAVTPSIYPDCLGNMSTAELDLLGASYITHTASYRTAAKPYFVDKLPGNWLHAGLIHLILPHAKIVDARRSPMASCFATFKQLLVGGTNYSYDLRHIARRYKDYAGFMAHLDRVLPDWIHRVQYETMVQDTEPEIRRLLAYCGLPFEAQCLRFWETDRVVRTPSAEQVRRPIFRDAVAQWRNYEPFLSPLSDVLGSGV